ncbi:MAG: hypothetical protein ACQERB_03165 [Promethearchaeati archaeon]
MSEKKVKKKKNKPLEASETNLTPKKVKRFVAILILGGILISGGIIMGNLIQNLINQGLSEHIVIPSSQDSNYDHFTSNNYSGAPEEYYSYYLWNLTNSEEFLAGGTPVYEEVGPFVFLAYKTKYDIEFNGDNTEVTYKEYVDYVQIEGENISEVEITNINPGLLGAFEVAGGTERNFLEMNLPFVLSQVKQEFKTIFTETMQSTLSNPDWVEQTQRDILKDCTRNLQGLLPGSVADIFFKCIEMEHLMYFLQDGMPRWEEVFYAEWGNDYFPQFNGNYEILISNISFNGEGIIETISAGAVENLMEKVLEDNEVQDAMDDIITKRGADMVDESGSINGLGVDIDGQYNYTDGSEADLNITNTRAVETSRLIKIFSELVFWPIYAETTMNLPLYTVDIETGLNFSQCAELWDENNSYSLTKLDYETNKTWFEALSEDQSGPNRLFLKNEFNLNDIQLEAILRWINTSVSTWEPNVIEYTLNDWNSGVISTRTAEEWLFSARDNAIINYMNYYGKDTNLASVNIFDDIEDETEAEYEQVKSYTIKTGQDDMNNAKTIVKYDGTDTIEIWDSPEIVGGTDGMQFHQGISKEETLQTFQPDLMRVVDLEYVEDTSIHGIRLLRFTLNSDCFAPNEKYYMDTPGIINLSPVEQYQGVPVRVSKPHFLGCEHEIADSIIGINPIKENHETFIDVEPISGITMNAKQRIQINFEVNPSNKLKPNINESIMPIIWFERSGEVPKELASEFSSQVYPALTARSNIMFWGIQIGAILTVTGGTYTGRNIVVNRKMKNQISPKKKGKLKKPVPEIKEEVNNNVKKPEANQPENSTQISENIDKND